MIFKNYLPHSLEYTNQSFLIKFRGVDSDFKLPGTASPFQDLPSTLPSTSFSIFPKFSVGAELPEIIKTSPSALSNLPQYPQSSTENFFTKNISGPLNNWLKGSAKEDILQFTFENGYDIVTELLDRIKEIQKDLEESNNFNDIFYNTSLPEHFNGGIGNDTVVYEGNHADYLIMAIREYPLGAISGYKVIENNGNTVDTLSSIERLEFADGHSNLGVIGVSEIFYPLV